MNTSDERERASCSLCLPSHTSCPSCLSCLVSSLPPDEWRDDDYLVALPEGVLPADDAPGDQHAHLGLALEAKAGERLTDGRPVGKLPDDRPTALRPGRQRHAEEPERDPDRVGHLALLDSRGVGSVAGERILAQPGRIYTAPAGSDNTSGGVGEKMALSIIEWKRTPGQYIAILQVLDRFEAGSIKESERHGFETILGGTLRGTTQTDWYALAYNRRELEFDEARDLARKTLDRYRQEHRY